nr:Holliday junction resolvase RuvX [Anaerolineae bacterium]
MTEQRRIMGIDHGEVRIGIALSDPFGLFAQPHGVLSAQPSSTAYQTIAKLVSEFDVIKIVVGLPTASDGGTGMQAKKVIEWASRLVHHIDIPLVFWDESYSTHDASKTKPRKGTPPGRRHQKPIDHIAAATFLQEYLDVSSSEYEPGMTLDDTINTIS